MEILSLAWFLIGLAVLLLGMELVLPTGGILFLLASASLLAGVGIMFYAGESTVGLVTLLATFLLIPVAAWATFYVWPRTPFGKHLAAPVAEEMTVDLMPGNAGLHDLDGKIGKTISMLRPSGTVDFAGRRIDAMSEGMAIDSGKPVRCIGVKAGKVVVRQIEPLSPGSFETTDFN